MLIRRRSRLLRCPGSKQRLPDNVASAEAGRRDGRADRVGSTCDGGRATSGRIRRAGAVGMLDEVLGDPVLDPIPVREPCTLRSGTRRTRGA